MKARTVVNAAGCWANRLPHSRVKLRLTKGIHLWWIRNGSKPRRWSWPKETGLCRSSGRSRDSGQRTPTMTEPEDVLTDAEDGLCWTWPTRLPTARLQPST